MSLYLCVFDGDEELEGIEVGFYDDFAAFRQAVADALEGGQPGSRFPTLMNHSEYEGTWSPEEAHILLDELLVIANEMIRLNPIALSPAQQEIAAAAGLRPRTLIDCFFDVDGVPLIPRPTALCEVAQRSSRPILFQ